MKTDYRFPDKGTKFNIDWSSIGILVVIFLPVVVLFLFSAWQLQMFEEAQNKNIEARCKAVGGQMGYSKCYKDGKEI